MPIRQVLSLVVVMALSACGVAPERSASEGEAATLTGEAPIIIAHRGASGERPEHTLAAYVLAIEQGADFIEPDLVLTGDGVLVVRHENEISETTDVAERTEFAGRRTVRVIDGQERTGWFTEDFTLAELKTLRARERLPRLRPGSTRYDDRYEVPTFEEVLLLLEKHERQSGKRIGVYPETKHPGYFASVGLPHDGPMLALLAKYGFSSAGDPVFIQSFEVGNLKALAGKTDIRLVQLVAGDGGPPDRAGQTYSAMLTSDGLKEVATYAAGIGPPKDLVIGRNALGQLRRPTGLVGAAHNAGLLVHPWTFRAENHFLPTGLKSGIDPRDRGDLAGEIRAFLAAGVDGLFTDHPGQAVAVSNR